VRAGSSVLGRRHVATTFFIGVSVLVYVGLLLGGDGLFDSVRRSQALRWGALEGRLGLAEPWRFLTAMFVHFSLLHVGLNVLSLRSLGHDLEDSIGAARVTLIFLGTGIGGFVVSQIWYTPVHLTGGISGGVFGLLGAAAGWRYAQGDEQWKRLAMTGAGYAAVMALLPMQMFNNAAHVGGLVLGAALAWALFRVGRSRSVERTLNGLAVVLVLAMGVSIVLSLTSPLTTRRAEVVPRVERQVPLLRLRLA
jgi:rhomboid protease GluP